MAISKEILEGRTLVEAYRSTHNAFPTTLFTSMACTSKVRAESHDSILKTLHEGLVKLGFKNIDDFFAQSYKADDAAVESKEIDNKARWG